MSTYNLLFFLSTMIFVGSSCSTRNSCKSFFSYQTNTLDVRGLSKTLNKKDKVNAEFSLGRILIKKDAVDVSERLRELDMLQVYLCSQVQSLEKGFQKDSLKLEVVKTTLAMLKLAQTSPDSSLYNNVSLLRNEVEETKADLEIQKKTISSISINTKVRLSSQWGEGQPYMTMISRINGFNTVTLMDSLNNQNILRFYLTDYKFSKQDSTTLLYTSQQSISDGTYPLGEQFSKFDEYNVLWFMVPFLDWKLKPSNVDILGVEVDIFLNGKLYKRIVLSEHLNQQILKSNFHSWVEQYIEI